MAARHMWIWRGVAKSALVDPSRPPASAQEHQRRCKDGLWGIAFARPHPVRVLGKKDGFTIVQETGEKKPVKVHSSILLPWSEGLLVIAEIKRSLKGQERSFKWLIPLLRILKNNASEVLASASYVHSMIDTAITGPKFICSDGHIVAHRRTGMNAEPTPAEVVVPEDCYPVKDLLDFLPAWEAFLHPNCGLYQDYYLVSWGAPYDAVSYAGTESGHERPGCSWEPDECLPMDLDLLRVSAKRRYVEGKQNDNAASPQKEKRQSAGGSSSQNKKLRVYNPRDLPDAELFEDIWNPSVQHGFFKRLDNDGDEFIKWGWPLVMSQYPRGHGPANPPGLCNEQCTCMEDWRPGKSTPKVSDTQEREWEAQKALESFIPPSVSPQGCSDSYVKVKGTRMQQCHLEATSAKKLRQPGPSIDGERCLAANFSRLALAVMREAAQNLPLKALINNLHTDGGLLRAFAPAFQANPLDWAACQVIVIEGPDWLQVSPSGACSMDPWAMESVAGSPPAKLILRFVNFKAEDDHLECQVDPSLPSNGGPTVERLTKRLVQNIFDLEAQASFTPLSAELSEIYDFRHQECKSVSLGRWAQVVSGVALLSRAFAVSHLERPLVKLNGSTSTS